MSSGANVIAKATGHLGKGGSFVWNKYGLARGTAYCAGFVSYVMAEAGCGNLFYRGKPVFYVPDAHEWLKANCTWVKMADARVGDIAIFTWDGIGYNSGKGSRDHIGFIRCAGSSGTAYTIEGNTNGGIVANRTRASKYIHSIWRPKYTESGDSTPSTGKIAVDGEWGQSTTRNLQKVLGTPQDGIVSGQRTACKKYLPNCLVTSWKYSTNGRGSVVIKALQRKIGVTADGIMGRQTVLKLQSWLGTPQDGICGKATVKALQGWINSRL